ncbi:DUF1716-domain-containing protein [Ascobolus immersus RN42]|uniref:DUF1716-domain-containing protein n=1 Tax=Ascobolus immersus RN42 TaxID=1160509 RepID=A0A3N4I5A1_ASCIM|nr:DUF1716-domain-containing protein [Ascobolus immersus RN42]
MTDVNDLFKKPALPASNIRKRKAEPSLDPVAAFKAAKLDADGSGKLRATAEEDGEGGPQTETVEFNDDDEDGRFYGGGVSKQESEILDYIDKQDQEGEVKVEVIDSAWLRRTSLEFEKKINKNAEMRGKYEDEPHKFMDSEADLDTAIRSLSILSEHPELFPEFAKLGTLGSLVGLLAHENTDIAIEVVEVLSELTDDEVDVEPEQWNALVKGMTDAQLFEMMTSNLERLNESNESDKNGVYHTLSVFENLASQQSTAEAIVKQTNILTWLIQRIQVRESPITQNKQYSAELLAILLQASPLNRKAFIKLEGMDSTLQLLSPYRKRDPVKGGDEEELVENLFDALTCTVDEPEGKEKFVENEGVELMLIMLREGKMAKVRALRVLDHAVSGGQQSVLVCERIVEAAGLKTIFGNFMKKQEPQAIEHLLGIFAAMLRSLPADTPERIRTLAKFVEKDYEKIKKLITLRREYLARLQQVDRMINKQKAALSEEEQSERAEEWFSRRLDAGLFCLQMTDVILAWLCAEDDGARNKIKDVLAEKKETLEALKATLNEQLELMDDLDNADQQVQKDMLLTLVQFL